MASEVVPLLQLMQTKGIGLRSLAKILNRLDDDALSLGDILAMEAAELMVRFGLTVEQVHAVHANAEPAARLAELLDEHGVRTVLRGSPAYPARLTTVLSDKAPPVLFIAGTAELLLGRGVGFCGARDASEEAIRCAQRLAGALAKQGLLAVSGHAQGVDESAHRAALESGGTTAFVLPEGILHFRPRPSLASLLDEDQFAVVSEFPPKLPWSVSNAMQRNRTICGLVEALIVVEAGTSGGTWEAGVEAIKLGIPLFVLEFADPGPSAQGNRLLVKKGGTPVPCPRGELPDLQPLLEALNTTKPAKEQLLF